MFKSLLDYKLEISGNDSHYINDITTNQTVKKGDKLFSIKSSSSIDKPPISYYSPIEMTIQKIFVGNGEEVSNYDSIFLVSTNVFSAPETQIYESLVDKKIWDLAISVNSVFKGLLGSMGESGQIASRTVPVGTWLDTNTGIHQLIEDIALSLKSKDLEDGDVVVVAEKPFAVSQRRLVPQDLILRNDPKKLDEEGRKLLLEKLKGYIDTPIDKADLILADMYEDDIVGRVSTVGAYNHNELCSKVSSAILKHINKKVDVVISDTDTGIDVRDTIIGCITLGATPVGCTKGLSLYEAMRASCAAEFTRGSTAGIPIVICKPAERCRIRNNIGDFRGYHGKLSYNKEGKIAFA
ncbi:hypothetical protein P4475_17895 [Halalkalibacterium halodurans]|uniref:hypothetical protein n=1 Tax=Halalkalibacterium halodurans TaxID=86665 RepID=UPI002E24EB42|nr:hypothetical protein [Halalkalibacterium halodurans]